MSKEGGDVSQSTFGAQGNLSAQELANVAPGAAGILEGIGGSGLAAGGAFQNVDQNLDQTNVGIGGAGGSDNIHADTNIIVDGQVADGPY